MDGRAHPESLARRVPTVRQDLRVQSVLEFQVSTVKTASMAGQAPQAQPVQRVPTARQVLRVQ